MTVMNVSLLLFGGSETQAGRDTRRVGRRPVARARAGRRRGSGRPQDRRASIRARHPQSAGCATASG
ncbi:MAG: hypothetical protein JSU73_02335 [candidate division WOR-3 bacterium]|nr:MAG: hypothetical protein JSU73_02335 [candidate division WOR-3 bacterium]